MTTNEKGSAYIFVLVIMLTVFLMLGISLTVSSYERKVTEAFGNRSSLYGLAVSGVENIVCILNEELEKERRTIEKSAADEIFSKDLKGNTAYVVSSLTNRYNGDFHLKTDDTVILTGKKDSLYEQAFISQADLKTKTVLNENAGKFYLEHKIDDDELYRISIQAEQVIKNAQTIYMVTSTAENSQGKSTTVMAEVMLSAPKHDEILMESYKWRAAPIQFDQSIGVYRTDDFTDIQDNSIFDSVIDWTIENPITKNQDTIDISRFYDNDQPVYTAVIGETDITLTASDPNKNIFYGIIVLNGSIIRNAGENINITGTVVSKSELGDVTVNPDPDALFKINFSDKAIRRKLFDYLKLTDFKSISSLSVNKSADIQTILDKLDFDHRMTVEIRSFDQVNYRIKKIKELEN